MAEVGGVRGSVYRAGPLVRKKRGGAKGRHLFRSEEAWQRTGDGPLGYQRQKTSGSYQFPAGASASACAQGTRKAGCGKTARPV